MLAFLDFEASSLARHSYPIEVAWVFENGASEAYLIRPAPGWDDWDVSAEAIHHIPRATLLDEGVAHDAVARRMVEQLAGHDLTASAPSWDGKWLSTLLRAAGLPRHALRLRDSDEAQREAARTILRDIVAADRLDATVESIRIHAIAARAGQVTAHRALADAQEERERWRTIRAAATQFRDAQSPHPAAFVTRPHD
ncbi:MAG TPA: transcriptional regulator [Sphingomonas sp.]|uniref:transcriptional regulator n=1 Tax=Sphingomonas sp. TaxID=28214 RepID=UPI002C6EC270|nr:transcriptional regulator [Sphingomonas sp.]HMI20151.1 transcriptional regulator [Sphingomonas sp.]